MVLVKFVLSAMPIFLLLAVHQPKWVIKQIDKLRRVFLWAGSDTVCGGKCLICWTQVCSPISLGGLGITDLCAQERALKLRWLWQSVTKQDKPWQGLQLPIDKYLKSLFIASNTICINNGSIGSKRSLMLSLQRANLYFPMHVSKKQGTWWL